MRKVPVDTHALWAAVQARGGYEAAGAKKLWATVGRLFNHPPYVLLIAACVCLLSVWRATSAPQLARASTTTIKQKTTPTQHKKVVDERVLLFQALLRPGRAPARL